MRKLRPKLKRGTEFVSYRCKHCDFVTPSRKEIRNHVKEVHGVKGGKNKMGISRNPLSEHYKVMK